MRRLRTFMRDEVAQYAMVIEEVKEHEPELALQLQRRMQRLISVRAIQSIRMKAVEEEMGVDGSSRYGEKLGMGVEDLEKMQQYFSDNLMNNDDNEDVEDDDESRENTYLALMSFANAD